ncbi:phospholipase D-like domain-containing protein [Mucilaginibacter sp. FT3.2]|uniref:phospholipase D-like domain-containing protein n=1 Tax=Mucilaginibacter sp. FT3.2 TaxID=2723090 RepID=UPI00161AECC1|nr:phospholipase D-like domain-containing protein [Mucilaginibacter sp. FT3.2]MBB6233027.1 phage host-nuclease inhibitor protein Gam [Mucilaginibacter sp. FT3.2]
MIDTIDQQVIDDNKEIFATILAALQHAEFEILIATAWFTDDELFAVVLDKIAEGVHVEIIVADNQENEKLDFNLLVAKGAIVNKIKNIGYGIMNQKFCVIDKRLALHGSYNWTVNAKKNNHESIIKTNHEQTVQSLINNFNTIKQRIVDIQSGIEHSEVGRNSPERPTPIPITLPLKAGEEFEKVLDSMIAAEIGSFDRKLLREQGFERSKLNSGDHQVLSKAFDTVYSVFINDIDVIDDKKKRLQTKIDEHRIKTRDALTKTCELEIDHCSKNNAINKTNLENEKSGAESEVAVLERNIEQIQKDKIPFIERQNEELNTEIKKSELEFFTPKIKWYELIPTAIFNVALLSYLFVFYSSAAYILLFSVGDAKEAEAQNIPIAVPQIFNAHAISKAVEKGWVAFVFICLFVFIPLSFAMADRFIKTKWVNHLIFWTGIIFLDGAVAYKVTQSIYEVNYARGNVNTPWIWNIAFSDTNFYLVFVFGALGLLMFKFALKKLMQLFEDRDPDILTQKNQMLVKQLRADLEVNLAKIMTLKEEISMVDKQVIRLKSDIKLLIQELANLPLRLADELQRKQSKLITDLETIDKIASIYVMHIQSDNLPISVDALKDRINVFLEGWNDFLYQEYAIPKANSKTAQATEIAIAWQKEKLYTDRVDKRVKFNTGE